MIFAAAWAIPAWLVFEATPTKLTHYVLPLYPALVLVVALRLVAVFDLFGLVAGNRLFGVVGCRRLSLIAACDGEHDHGGKQQRHPRPDADEQSALALGLRCAQREGCG